MSSGPSIVRQPAFEKSNVELVNGLRSNFTASREASVSLTNGENGHLAEGEAKPANDNISFSLWTSKDGDCLHIPSKMFQATELLEESSDYDITVKLFLLPKSLFHGWRRHLQDAVAAVLQELGVGSITLLIVSFPGISFDADTEGKGGCGSNTIKASESELLDAILDAWKEVELMKSTGKVLKVGIAEFGVERLQKFLPKVKHRPTVDQINVRDCCVLPGPMMVFAKQENLELLTHNDCTNILPQGTLRDLLGSGDHGAGVLAGLHSQGEGLSGDIRPEWVVKYTAVIRERGVIENKGYFASAELSNTVAG
ncbi:MAG: hypothetical protein Q9174_004214 [Haloplaca sp. 1 TL-2023]